jgi:hypothetical protein
VNGDVHDHVSIVAGKATDGSSVTEAVPARSLGGGSYEVLATPGLAIGCAAGDRIQVDSDGSFSVSVRGGNVALHVYSATVISASDLARLREIFAPLKGHVEAPVAARFAVVTVPAAAGFPAIEQAIGNWIATQADVDWYFGNVYDDNDNPLGWWE